MAEISSKQGDKRGEVPGVFHRMIVDYYQNMANIEQETINMKGNQTLTVPTLAN